MKMKEKVFVLTFILGVMSNCYCENNEIFKDVRLNLGNAIQHSINENYGNLWIGYIKGDIEFENYGQHYFTIERINYYYKKSEEFIFLGYVDKDGVYGKNGELVKKCPFVDSDKSRNIGLSSRMINNPFGVRIVMERNNYISNLDSYAVIRVEFVNDTLAVNELTY